MAGIQTLELLNRTGCLTPGHSLDGEKHMDVTRGALDPLIDPTAVSELGRRLADALPEPKPDVLLVWPGLPSIIIGFAAGTHLNTPVVMLADDEGLVTGSGSIAANQRVALVGVTLSDRDARLARAFVESSGGSLETMAALVGSGQDDSELCLVSLQDHTFTESDCPHCRES